MAEPTMKTGLAWTCRNHALRLVDRPLIMGILNVTPDSFSDGNRYAQASVALTRARQMVEEGADIIDVGGESSRPGAEPVSIDEELRRLLPVLEPLCAETTALVSVDTTKAEVARRALAAGVHIVNDISALTADPEMGHVAAEARAGVVLMHRQGISRTMQVRPRYDDVTVEVRDYLQARMIDLAGQGLDPECMVIDPGIGFGKTVQHNVELLAGLNVLADLGRPVLVGVSRKSFLGHLLHREVEDRLVGSLGALAYAIGRGAHILRVHDVKESCEMARLLAIFKAAEERR